MKAYLGLPIEQCSKQWVSKNQDLEKPLVGVSSTCNEATPCNIHLGKLAQCAKDGIKDAGCTPREFTCIAVSDAIAMGHEGMKASLVSREIIADSIEVMMMAHQYDAIVGISGCDKSLPGSLMGMARLNLPAIFVYGGTDYARELGWQTGNNSRCL